MIINDSLREQTVSVAKSAGSELKRLYRTGIKPQIKPDGTVVTAADLASEKIVMEGLAKLLPNMPILSEEQVAQGIIPDLSSGNFWCVDPLDGTKHFVNGTDGFAVLIGLILNGVPQMGVVHMPILDKTCSGGKGIGITWEEKGSVAKLSPPLSSDRILVDIYEQLQHQAAHDFLASNQRKYPHEKLDFAPTHDPYRYLSTITGECSTVLYFGPSFEWDTAAPHGVLQGFNHHMKVIDDSALRYGKSPDFSNPALLVKG